MKKYSIKMKFETLLALDHWLDARLSSDSWKGTFSELSSMVLVKEWQVNKLKPNTYFRYHGAKAFKMGAATALALGSIIEGSNSPPTDYLGIHLLRMLSDIDQYRVSIHN